MNKKTLILSIIVIALFATVASWVYFVFSKKPVSQPVDNQKQVTQKELPPNGCLEENEIAGYNIKEKTGENGGILAIDVKNKLDKKSIQSFEIKKNSGGMFIMVWGRTFFYLLRNKMSLYHTLHPTFAFPPQKNTSS